MNKQNGKQKPIVQIQPIFSEVKESHWWEYKVYGESEIESIKQFFRQNEQSLHSLMGQNIFENYRLCAQNIGVHPHPAVKCTPTYFIEQKDENMEDN